MCKCRLGARVRWSKSNYWRALALTWKQEKKKKSVKCLGNHIHHIYVTEQAWVWCRLTNLPLDKMTAISQKTFSNAFSWTKRFIFRFENHWGLFSGVQIDNKLALVQVMACRREQATSHYLNKCRPSSPTHICDTSGRWVKRPVTHWGLMRQISTNAFGHH